MKYTAKFSVLFLLILGACADKEVRLWIEPPVGYRTESQRSLYYNIEDVQSGKKQSVAIPVNQLPENLVVEADQTAPEDENLAAATKADTLLGQTKPTAPLKEGAPTLSYLRGVRAVEDLYRQNQYEEALIKLAPLVEQYPQRPRLFVMQGTLYRQLGEKRLAYKAYKAAHELDKEDPKVAEAFYRLQNEAGEKQ
jgi:tetratricopeptide (TPR) repeat protein